MNLKLVKKDEKIEFHGISINREYRGDELYSVTVEFEDDTFFKVAKDGWSGLQILVKEPPKKVKKWKAYGKYRDANICQVFLDEISAIDFCADLSGSSLIIEAFEDVVTD